MTDPTLTIGPIMKAARKFKKFNQAAVAQAIGCSQSALSKMEHNLLVPSAPQWFLFSRFTAIPPETLESGIINRETKVKFNSSEVSLGFKIPKKYRNYRAEKVREVYPFIQYLEKHHGVEGVKEYVQFTGLDPEFFLDFDNLINFQLFADTIQYFIRKGYNTSAAIKEIVSFGQNETYWNDYSVEWKKLKTPVEVIREYVNDQLFFQTDFKLILDERSNELVLCYIPEFHLRTFKDLNEDLVNFLSAYRKFTLENLVKMILEKDVTLELTDEGQGLSLATRYQVRV